MRVVKQFLSCSLLLVSTAAAQDLSEAIQPYGSLRPEVILRFPETGDQVRRMDDGYSRLGIKGSVELREGLSGFYKYERRVSANDGEDAGAVRAANDELREVYVGLKSDLGSVSMGRHYGLYYDYIDDELDRHRSHYSDAIIFGDLFVSNAVVFRSKSFGMGDFGVLVEFNDADTQGESIRERVEIAGTIRHRGLALHAGYVNSPSHDGLLGVAASYPFRALTFAAVYERFDQGVGNEDALVSLAVDADLTASNRARLAFTSKQDGTTSDRDEVSVISGIEHRYSDHFLVFVELFTKSSSVAHTSDESAVITGFRFDL